ncbi:MAG TPA: glycosyltransferase [Puia sp.]|uniref:glycosyltransferase n=1 Tax=Puia sp. TaxID=2045100 RepID=UPI002B6D64CB|nr:glycosyltransferase [Puia sp.]HVU95081.1 glycosyltransferase [Puia sp.]
MSVTGILFILVFVIAGLSVLYLFLLSFFGRFFYRERWGAVEGGMRRIAVLVPAYKEDGIIVSTARGLLALDYPEDLYDVYIVADSFQRSTVEELRRHRVKVVEVSFVKSTKANSLNEAFSRIGERYDIALICDADNVLAVDFLRRVNAAFGGGARVVQGRRVAKNLDSAFAVLDACSESIGNHIFRKGSNALGLSASLIGSGMAFEYGLLRDILKGIDSVVEDKVIQLRIAERGVMIHYLESAVVFDEKVSSSKAFQNQRRRWVSGQYAFLWDSFPSACRQLLKGDLNYFNLGFLHSAVPPRSFLLVLLPLLVVAGFFMGTVWGWVCAGLLVLFFFSLRMGIPNSMINKDFWRAVAKLPGAVMIMFGTLFHLRRGHKSFIHTVHTKTDVSNEFFRDTGK